MNFKKGEARNQVIAYTYECSLQDRIEGQRLWVEMWIARTTLWPRLPFYSATIDISLHEEGQIK